VSGVPGPPVLVVPADVRFIMRAFVLMGVMMLEDPDVRDDFDCELERVGCGLLAAFGARSLLENKPMSAAVVVRGCRPSGRSVARDRQVTAVCSWPSRDLTAGAQELS
jgi:hypothetical protein